MNNVLLTDLPPTYLPTYLLARLHSYLAIAREGWTTKEGAVKAAQIGIFYAERAPPDISQDADVQAAVAAYLRNHAAYSAHYATTHYATMHHATMHHATMQPCTMHHATMHHAPCNHAPCNQQQKQQQ